MSKRDFSSRNNYVELNIIFGKPHFLKKGTSNYSFDYTYSFGYRQSIERSPWKNELNNVTVEELNSTLLMGWYIKLSLGFGYVK